MGESLSAIQSMAPECVKVYKLIFGGKVMKKIFAAVLFMVSMNAMAASKWYYQCTGTITWPHCKDAQVRDLLTPNSRPILVRDCTENLNFTNNAEYKAATQLVHSYSFKYVGKSQVINGVSVQLDGVCEGWSNTSSTCNYAKDSSGNDLVCDPSNLGKYIVTP